MPAPTAPWRATAPRWPSAIGLAVEPSAMIHVTRSDASVTVDNVSSARSCSCAPLSSHCEIQATALIAAAPEVIADERNSGPRSAGRLLQRGTAVAASSTPVYPAAKNPDRPARRASPLPTTRRTSPDRGPLLDDRS